MTESEIIDHMLYKYKTWNQKDADIFHNHTKREKIEGQYIWDINDDHVVLYRYAGVHMLFNDGRIYKLAGTFLPDDWDMHRRLYDEASDDCRIEIPIQYKIIDGLHFTEVHRPNNEFGRDFHIDLFEGLVNDDYVYRFIDEATTLISKMKVISQRYSVGLPVVGISPSKRMTDSLGTFWMDFKLWNTGPDKYISISLTNLSIFMLYIEHNMNIRFDKEILIKYAEESWLTI